MPNRSEPKNPLAEVFGFAPTDMSETAKRHREKRLCPFNNCVPNCTKDKAQNPLGVCSVVEAGEIVITCPTRFRQEWRITDDAADFFFPGGTNWTTLTEVRLKDADGKSAGNIDVVLCAYDDAGHITDFGALEVQAVYISGNVRDPFSYYMADPAGRANMDWSRQPKYPGPDYVSSSRKRLAPQLLFKGGILHAWDKKSAVALNKGFFATLPTMPEVAKEEAEIAWIIYDVKPSSAAGTHHQLVRERVVYTRFEPALNQITKARPGQLGTFLKHLQTKMDVKLENPPDTQPIQSPLGD